MKKIFIYSLFLFFCISTNAQDIIKIWKNTNVNSSWSELTVYQPDSIKNNHTAIIDRETWKKAQELLASGQFSRRGKPLAAMKKKFVVAKVKSGVLRGFMLLDMDWTKEERDMVIKIIENIEPDMNQAERSQDYGY